MLDRLDGVCMGVNLLMGEFSRELDDAEAPDVQQEALFWQQEPLNFQQEPVIFQAEPPVWQSKA